MTSPDRFEQASELAISWFSDRFGRKPDGWDELGRAVLDEMRSVNPDIEGRAAATREFAESRGGQTLTLFRMWRPSSWDDRTPGVPVEKAAEEAGMELAAANAVISEYLRMMRQRFPRANPVSLPPQLAEAFKLYTGHDINSGPFKGGDKG